MREEGGWVGRGWRIHRLPLIACRGHRGGDGRREVVVRSPCVVVGGLWLGRARRRGLWVLLGLLKSFLGGVGGRARWGWARRTDGVGGRHDQLGGRRLCPLGAERERLYKGRMSLKEQFIEVSESHLLQRADRAWCRVAAWDVVAVSVGDRVDNWED